MSNINNTVELVASYVANNPLPAADLPGFIALTHAAITGLGQPAKVEPATPAQIKASIKPHQLISFIDCKGYKILKRHLTTHGLTPQTYREKYGLPSDYPMTAAFYSAQRSELAKAIGLGGKKAKKPARKAPARKVA